MTDRIIIPSAHVNALGLVISLREMGWDGPITCLKRKPKQAALTERFSDLCDTLYLPLDRVDDLAPQLSHLFPDEQMLVLMTDERFLGALPNDGQFAAPKAAGRHNEWVCNKRQLYDFIQARKLAAVPQSIGSNEDPYAVFSGPFRTRVWSSWRGMARLPRGGLITEPKQLDTWRSTVEEIGLDQDEWGFQIQLSSKPRHNVSVCGWYDQSVHLAAVTRRRGVAHGLGWWIERIDDPAFLIGAATRILRALEYEGPYELEFVWDYRDACFRVIELNPRFWMQHRLVNVLSDNSLVRRALGIECTVKELNKGPRHWLQPDVAVVRPWAALPVLNDAVLGYPMRGVAKAFVKRNLTRIGFWYSP